MKDGYIEDEEEPIKGFMNLAMAIMLNTTKFLYAFYSHLLLLLVNLSIWT